MVIYRMYTSLPSFDLHYWNCSSCFKGFLQKFYQLLIAASIVHITNTKYLSFYITPQPQIEICDFLGEFTESVEANDYLAITW